MFFICGEVDDLLMFNPVGLRNSQSNTDGTCGCFARRKQNAFNVVKSRSHLDELIIEQVLFLRRAIWTEA